MNNTVFLLTGPRAFERRIIQLDDEVPKGHVLVEFEHCGICGGDYSCYIGRREGYPKTLGHEFIARVLETGPGVSTVKDGDLVVSDLNYRCGECPKCRAGESHLCKSNDAGLFSNRGFADKAIIHQSYLCKVDQGALPSLPDFCLIEPLSCVIHACDIALRSSDKEILVIGGGSIGMLFCLALRAFAPLAEVTVAEVNEARRHNLMSVFDVREFAPGCGDHDLVIDASNSLSGISLALSQTVPGGRLCVMSHLYGEETSFVYEQICQKELRASFPLRNGERSTMDRAYSLLKGQWRERHECLIETFPNVVDAMEAKALAPSCKQVVSLRAACREAR